MKLKPSLEKKSSLAIVIVVVALLIFFVALFLSASFLENEEVVQNMTLEELPKEVKEKINNIKLFKNLA
jgi:uncharacterized membrane protein affecting hemolysin expression